MAAIDNLKLEELVKRGSATARNGFKNEKDIVKKFNSWQTDGDAQAWLKVMGYKLSEVESVKAERITGSHKTDVQVEIQIELREGIAVENISIKLVSNANGFNQIDKRWVDTYAAMWGMPEKMVKDLKHFTGEVLPTNPSPHDSRRIFLDELSTASQKEILSFFEKNKILVISDLFKGRDSFPASWFLLYQKDIKVWTLLPIAIVMNFYGQGPVRITKQGSLKIGKVGMQRKGGDNGRPSANMLQFKIDPCEMVKASLVEEDVNHY